MDLLPVFHGQPLLWRGVELVGLVGVGVASRIGDVGGQVRLTREEAQVDVAAVQVALKREWKIMDNGYSHFMN